jgi:hypothetical protein
MARHSYDDQETTRAWWKRLVRRSKAMQGVARMLREIARQGYSQPIQQSLAQRIEATAGVMSAAEQRLEQLHGVVRAALAAENQRHENPRGGSVTVEAKADAGAYMRDPH